MAGDRCPIHSTMAAASRIMVVGRPPDVIEAVKAGGGRSRHPVTDRVAGHRHELAPAFAARHTAISMWVDRRDCRGPERDGASRHCRQQPGDVEMRTHWNTALANKRSTCGGTKPSMSATAKSAAAARCGNHLGRNRSRGLRMRIAGTRSFGCPGHSRGRRCVADDRAVPGEQLAAGRVSQRTSGTGSATTPGLTRPAHMFTSPAGMSYYVLRDDDRCRRR
jgi:hypothetical protein